jgi:hypothetical protein
MKKIGTALLLLSTTLTPLAACNDEIRCYNYTRSDCECYLTSQERDQIWMEIHFTVKKINMCLERAESEARLITNIDDESVVRGAVSGAIAGIASGSFFRATIGTCLATISRVACDSCVHYMRSRTHVQDADFYAYHADQLQDRLWRDE